MKDEIIIIVKRDDGYHKLNKIRITDCDKCSLCGHSNINGVDICDICTLFFGCFEKVVTDEEHKQI